MPANEKAPVPPGLERGPKLRRVSYPGFRFQGLTMHAAPALSSIARALAVTMINWRYDSA
jgi:hypothetical protein